MLRKLFAAGALPLLAACSLTPPASDKARGAVASPWEAASVSDASALPWRHMPLPGKRATTYVPARVDGRDVMVAHAESSASLLRQTLRVEPPDLGRIAFSWKVPALIAQADLGQREHADSPVRVVLVFDGDRTRFSLKNTVLSELAHSLTGEPMPYATLMYVWCNTRPVESIVESPRTGRIRKLVVESGAQGLNRWRDYERDIRADFERAFGEPPGALLGVAIMTDTDNTRTSARAWYGPLRLAQGGLPPQATLTGATD